MLTCARDQWLHQLYYHWYYQYLLVAVVVEPVMVVVSVGRLVVVAVGWTVVVEVAAAVLVDVLSVVTVWLVVWMVLLVTVLPVVVVATELVVSAVYNEPRIKAYVCTKHAVSFKKQKSACRKKWQNKKKYVSYVSEMITYWLLWRSSIHVCFVHMP